MKAFLIFNAIDKQNHGITTQCSPKPVISCTKLKSWGQNRISNF